MLLDSELKTKKHVESLAFNRGASTIGETKAISYIERELSSVNLESHYQYFHWTGPTRVLMRVSYLVVVTYLLLSRLFLLLIAYIVIKLSFERTRQLSLIKKDSSKNIYTKILAKNQQIKRPVVIFSAHYDSISANISYRVQVLMFLIYRLIIGFYVCIIFILSIWLTLDIFYIYSLPTNIVILVSILSLFGIVTSIPILYLVFNEKPSSCSIDNASGVAILIELAKLFKKNPLENMDLYFIWTGAEEWGLKGSKTFCANNIIYLNEEYDLDKSINVNIDMVGTYIGLLDKVGLPLRRRLNKNVNNILEATANSLNIPIKRFNKIVEPKSDHIVFRRCAKRARKNIQVVFFHSDKDSKYIHSLRDTPDKCKSENLNGCLAICYQALRSIDSRIE
ncbi:MAG: M28 family metallopeptidase [Promethearchaeota archaeon]